MQRGPKTTASSRARRRKSRSDRRGRYSVRGRLSWQASLPTGEWGLPSSSVKRSRVASSAMPTYLTIDAVNAFDAAAFTAHFGDVAEDSPWVAEVAFGARPFAGREVLVEAFDAAVRAASREAQLALLRAHPDLASRAAVAGDVAEESRREQAGAGLDRLTEAEFARFHDLNAPVPRALRIPVHLRGEGGDEGCDPRRVRGPDPQRCRNRARDGARQRRAHPPVPHRGPGGGVSTRRAGAARRGAVPTLGDGPAATGHAPRLHLAARVAR